MDTCTLSNYTQISISAAQFDLIVDLEGRSLHATTDYTLLCLQPCDHVLLDTASLNILDAGVRLGSDTEYKPVNFTMSPEEKPFGQALRIPLGSQVQPGSTVEIRVRSKTSEKCSGIQWMAAAETAGRTHPYCFSQCQAIHARSIVPCMDTPGVKFRYSARVQLNQGLRCVMSALSQKDEAATFDSPLEPGMKEWFFTQPVPIPSYLFAIAAGNIARADLSERCAVYTEPEMLDQCKYEFAEVENMLKTAESFCGPYVWSRYDFLVLPPTFPYGGMENPNMTFLSPTLVVGDRSMVSVLCHEIAHSWTGNLVTNCNWDHFWLNEGWTVFLERKIKARLDGNPLLRHFLAREGVKHLKDDIEAFKTSGKFELTSLIISHQGVDPDDSFSAVPYEKGSGLLLYLEEKLGGPEVFEPYMKSYFQTFAHKSIDTETWRQSLFQYFTDKQAILESVPWDDIFNTPGMPVVKVELDDSLSSACSALADRWLTTPDNAIEQVLSDPREFTSLSPDQRIEVLSLLLEAQREWSAARFHHFTSLYALDKTANCELQIRWIRIGLQSRLDRVIPPALDLVTRQGRMKFTRPAYRALYEFGDPARQQAVHTFTSNRPFMNPICAALVQKDLHLV